MCKRWVFRCLCEKSLLLGSQGRWQLTSIANSRTEVYLQTHFRVSTASLCFLKQKHKCEWWHWLVPDISGLQYSLFEISIRTHWWPKHTSLPRLPSRSSASIGSLRLCCAALKRMDPPPDQITTNGNVKTAAGSHHNPSLSMTNQIQEE